MKTCVLILLVFCLYGFAQSAARYTKVHEELNDAEFQKVFHRTRRNVPDYELVKIESKKDHRSKRELRPIEIHIDEKFVHLNLHPVEHTVFSNYIPVWLAESDPENKSAYHPINHKESKLDGVFYEDPKTMATLLAYYKDRYIHFDGIFGESRESKVVRAVPEKWWKEPGANDDENHFVYGVNRTTGNTISIVPDKNDSKIEKLDKPLDTFYPKLLVIVDYTLFKNLGEDVQETIKYVATFWNAVNLKYSKIEAPKIKIIITGLIIAKDEKSLHYIYQAQNSSDLTQLDPFKMLNLGKEYFRFNFVDSAHFDNYDATMTMSSLNTGINKGAAYMGQICSEHLNIGYVQDDGNFAGVLSATHELGHLLNLPHDGKEANGCPGYINDDVSTVMAPYTSSVKEYVWSECSKKTLKKFAWNKKAECLRHHHRTRQH